MIFLESYILNIYTLILLLILLLTMIVKKEAYRYSSRILKRVIILTSVLLIIEILSWSFDGIDAPYARILNYSFNLIFFLGGAVVVGVFFSYVDYLIFKSKERLKRRFYYMHLLSIFTIMAIINIFTPLIFSVSSDNVYQREFWINAAFVAVFIKLIYMLILVWLNRKHIESGTYYSIFIFSIIPLIGGILQMIFFGLLIMWAFLGLSVVIAYIFIETFNNSKDFLTKLYTREIAEEYINQLLYSGKDALVILFDIDNLKFFNDRYGHETGDLILTTFAQALDHSFPNNALVSRHGGDEFLVVLIDNDQIYLNQYFTLLRKKLDRFKLDGCSLNYSYGHISSKEVKDPDIKSLFNASDKAMYKQKAEHKTVKNNTYH